MKFSIIHHPSSIIRAPRSRERGNVFLFILIGVILFAALSFTTMRGFRGETTNRMSEREAALAASDILTYAQRLQRGVDRLRRRGTSESDIDFTNPGPDENSVFNTQGGAVSFQDPPTGASTGTWIFTGSTCVVGVGTGAAGCDSDTNTRNEELLVVLPDIDEAVCTAINSRLDIDPTPADAGTGHSTTAFAGFADGTELNLVDSPPTACYTDGSDFHFYSVLLER